MLPEQPEVDIDMIRRATAIIDDVPAELAAETGDMNAAADERIDFAAKLCSLRSARPATDTRTRQPSVQHDRPGRQRTPSLAAMAPMRGSGDERLPISRIDKEQPEFAGFRHSKRVRGIGLVTGILAPFEGRDRTTENRGVPGSSPGLATATTGMVAGFTFFRFLSPHVEFPLLDGRRKEMAGGHGAQPPSARLGARTNTWISGRLERKRP
jgi:hypothetical protein